MGPVRHANGVLRTGGFDQRAEGRGPNDHSWEATGGSWELWQLWTGYKGWLLSLLDCTAWL